MPVISKSNILRNYPWNLVEPIAVYAPEPPRIHPTVTEHISSPTVQPPIAYRTVTERSPIAHPSLTDRLPIAYRSLSDRSLSLSDRSLSLSDRLPVAHPSLSDTQAIESEETHA